MGLIDSFTAEDRVEVKYTDFYNFVRGCTERDVLLNAIKTRVPYEYIERMMTGNFKINK